MTYDGLVLAAIVAELNGTIRGSRIQDIRQHSQTDLTIEVRSPGHTYRLFLSVDARFSRAYLTATNMPVPKTAPQFCMVLRKHIEGAYVSQVEQVGFDRVMRLRLQRHGEPERVLVLEIMGKHSNLILVDEANKILGAAKHVGSSVSRYRQVLPGRDYLPPPGSDKVSMLDVSEEQIAALWQASLAPEAEIDSVRQWLMATFSGLGPFLVDEIIARAGVQSGVIAALDIQRELAKLANVVQRADYSPVLITSERGESLMVYPVRAVHLPTDRQHDRSNVNEPLDALFRSLVGRTLLEDERTQTLTAIRRAAASRRQTIKSIERTISESERADAHRQCGELILASLHAIEQGAASARLVNYFDPDMPEIDIELDAKLSPQQNAERYFKRFQKARDAASQAISRKAQVEKEIGLLEAALHDTEAATGVESLQNLRKMLLAKDLLRQEVRPQKTIDELGGHKIRRFFTPEGWEILYGETSQANDYLTQKVARPNDVWLHARSITGAHVVVRTGGHTGVVPRPVLMQAALIAARNSDAKHSSLVPIDHTFRKYVRKPRGGAPGFVTYRNEKTIDVDPKA